MADSVDSKALPKLREACLAKGFRGYRGIGRLFNSLDDNRDKNISLDEFERGMARMEVELSEKELVHIFTQFDRDDNKVLSVQEFLRAISPPMSAFRKRVVKKCFSSLDVTKDGQINIDDMRESRMEQARQHPKYLSGEWTLDQVFKSYVDHLAFAPADNTDAKITVEEMVNYYSGLSANISDDKQFAHMLKYSYGLE